MSTVDVQYTYMYKVYMYIYIYIHIYIYIYIYIYVYADEYREVRNIDEMFFKTLNSLESKLFEFIYLIQFKYFYKLLNTMKPIL